LANSQQAQHLRALEQTTGRAVTGWQTQEIDGKPADLFIPSRETARRMAVLFLHGHGQVTLRSSQAYTRELDRHGLRCICPMGKRSWWSDRPCAEFDPVLSAQAYLRERVLPWLAAQWGVHPPAIALLGVSMGGQGALKLAYKAPGLFPVVAALAPAIDFHLWFGRGYTLDTLYNNAEQARQDTATVLLNPLNWPRHQLLTCDPADEEWFESVERLVSKLRSTGIPFEADLATSAGGHAWSYFEAMAPVAIAFLAARLEQERLRLPAAAADEE
jgi:pimeloyl-ACP methyl ester carboxylesterase